MPFTKRDQQSLLTILAEDLRQNRIACGWQGISQEERDRVVRNLRRRYPTLGARHLGQIVAIVGKFRPGAKGVVENLHRLAKEEKIPPPATIVQIQNRLILGYVPATPALLSPYAILQLRMRYRNAVAEATAKLKPPITFDEIRLPS